MIRIHPLIYSLIALLLMIGTFYDLPISMQVFDPSSGFGSFFQAYGHVPSLFLCGIAAILLFKDSRNALTKCLFIVLVGILLMVIHRMTYLPLVVMVLLAIGMAWAAEYFSRKNYAGGIYWSKVATSTLIMSNITLQCLKMIWGRPRFKYITHPEQEFFPWYKVNHLTTEDVFMSFPSGHSANAAIIVCLVLLVAVFYSKNRPARWLAMGFAFIWTGLVMASRVVYGNHFVTDTAMGTLITLLFFQHFQNYYPVENLEDVKTPGKL